MNITQNKNKKSSYTERARQFFEISSSELANANPDIKYVQCKLCKMDINGSSGGNIVPHIKRKHKEEYEKYIATDIEENIELTRLILLQSCVEMATVNGKTFSTLSCSGFINSHHSTLEKLKKAGRPLNLKDEHLSEVKQHINIMAEKVRERIKNEVKGQLVPLMIDGATRNNRSILGVSIQYIVDGKAKVVVLGTKEIIERSTAEHLCSIVENVLEQYGLSLRSIITVTSDNAANMIATTHELEKELHNMLLGDSDTEEPIIADRADGNSDGFDLSEDQLDGTNLDQAIESALNESNITDEDILNSMFDENILHDDLLTSVGESLTTEINQIFFIDQVRCAIHTIQLAIKDAIGLMSKADSNVITLCRIVAKYLRVKSTQIELRKKNVPVLLPILDVETRWNSTYALVSTSNYFAS